jgi:hypothetical protein
MYGHGQISNKAYYQILSACSPDPIQTLLHGPLPPACNDQVQAAFASVGNYYGYGLYDDCNFQPNPWGPGPFQALEALPPSRRSFRRRRAPSHSMMASSDARAAVPPTIDIPGLEGYYCPGPALPIWINRTDVRKVMAGMRCASSCPAHLTRIAFRTQALNVDPSSNFFSGDNGVGFNYTLTERSVFRVFKAAIAKGLKVLVYNGDTDPGVNMEAIQDIAAAFAQQYVTSFVHSLFVTSCAGTTSPKRRRGGRGLSTASNGLEVT